jgi:tetratricopeptide (TPR) repeat protein
VKRVLELREGFAPAWVMRAELGEEEGDFDPEPDLRRAIALDPKLGRARYVLALLLHAEEGKEDESRAQMDAAIELDPTLHEAFAARGGWSRIEAWTDQAEEGAGGDGVFKTFTGMRIKRAHLERALADFERAIAVKPLPSYRFARADLLHRLQRFDEALAELDGLLAELPAEHPLHTLAADARKRSEGQGGGERDEAAKMLIDALEGTPEKERGTLEYDQASAVIRSVAQGVRSGKSIPEAMESFVPDSPEDMAAVSIAWQILQMAQEASPQYEPADPAGYPGHQRAHERKATKQLAKLGFAKLGDYEPVHLAVTLGRKQMLSLYVREDGQAGAAAFSLKPKWPGFVGWLLMALKGLYRATDVVEFETAFEDGTTLSTNNAGELGAFNYGPAFLQEKLPRGTPPASLYDVHTSRVKAHAANHPGVRILELRTIEEVSAQQARMTRAKNAYRRSIGFVSDDELRRMMGPQYDELAGKVREKLAAMAEQAEVPAEP